MKNQYNPDAFETVYTKYKTLLFRIAFTYLKNKSDCEDILQEVFTKYFICQTHFASDEHERNWFIRVTINLCKNHLNAFWNRNKVNLDDIQEMVTSPEEQTILEEVLNLPPKYKAVIYLHYVEGYKCKEIAQSLSIKESTVRMRLKKARTLLKSQLLEEEEENYETTISFKHI